MDFRGDVRNHTNFRHARSPVGPVPVAVNMLGTPDVRGSPGDRRARPTQSPPHHRQCPDAGRHRSL
ncbi:hypothetical protein ACFFX0_11110 [Citricoccus parietis]|uniref:Uncharacterized protein n=1 Tax=Citricoccus parietis TaxID=592307 RepID=A0ABV5FYI1_9MICC